MTVIRVPTPLRPFTEGHKAVEVSASTVGTALEALAERYPELHRHLYDESGNLRPFVNVFLNDEDIRTLQGEQTQISGDDRLMIVPSIAGGGDQTPGGPRAVDHNALRANQGAIITLLLLAFVLDLPWLAAFVGLVMLVGTAIGRPGFALVYRGLRSLKLVSPYLLPDNPEPHRFAQGFGGAVLIGAGGAFAASLLGLGWALVWLVIALAALNLFGGFCVGCAFYYWLNRIGVPGFGTSPPPGVFPGRRPPRAG